MGKNVKKLIFQLLPKSIKHKILRMNLNLSHQLPDGLSFKIAETKNELEQAFNLVHENYYKIGLIDSEKEKLRVTKYHAVPGTVVLIGKFNDEVIATLTVVLDSPLGLPTDAAFKLQFLRDQGFRLCEISALAIKKDLKILRGKLLFPLTHYMLQYVSKYMAADVIVCATHKKTKPFYEGILCFSELKGEVGNYQFVKDDKPSGQYLTLYDLEEKFKAIYENQPDNQNIYKYFFKTSFKQCHFPERKYHKITDFVMRADQLNYFFREKSEIFEEMEDAEKLNLKYAYFHDFFGKVIDPQGTVDLFNQRTAPRFPVKCSATFICKNGEIQRAVVESVGRTGLLAQAIGRFELGQDVQIQINVGVGESVKLVARIIRRNDLGKLGFVIKKSPEVWSRYITYLERDLLKGMSPEEDLRIAG